MSVEALAVASLVTTVGGTVMSATAQRKQGKQQAKWLKYNAAVSEAKAKSEERAASVAAGQKRAEGRRLRARQLALYAKAGVDPQVGSPLLTMQDTAIAIETDARFIELGGRERAGFFESEAGLLRSQASATKAAGRTAFATTLLTGLGSAGLGFATFKSNLPGTKLSRAGVSKGLSPFTASTITGRTSSGGFKFG